MENEVLTLGRSSRWLNRTLNEDQLNKAIGFSAFMNANKNTMHRWWTQEIRCKSDIKPMISICKRYAKGEICDSKCSFYHPPDIQDDNQVSSPTSPVTYPDTFAPAKETYEGLADLKTEKQIKTEIIECENNNDSETKKKKRKKSKKKKSKHHHHSDDDHDGDIQLLEVKLADQSNEHHSRNIKIEKLDEGMPQPTTVGVPSSLLVSCESLKRKCDEDHSYDSSPKHLRMEVPIKHEKFIIEPPPNYSNIDQSFLDSCTHSIEKYIKQYDLMKLREEKLCGLELLCRYVEQSKLKLLSLNSHSKHFIWDVYIRLFFITFYKLYENFDKNDYSNMINKSLSESTLHEFIAWVESEVRQNYNRT